MPGCRPLSNWCNSMARDDDHRCLFFEWAAINYSGVTYGQAERVRHMDDFVRAHADTFNPRWTLDRARAEEQKWDEELARREPVKDDEEDELRVDTVDYAPLPLRWDHGDLSFVAIQTQKALHAEGASMSHCVSSYWWSVVRGWSRIYSILKDGSRVATVELTSRYERYKWGNVRYRFARPPGCETLVRLPK